MLQPFEQSLDLQFVLTHIGQSWCFLGTVLACLFHCRAQCVSLTSTHLAVGLPRIMVAGSQTTELLESCSACVRHGGFELMIIY